MVACYALKRTCHQKTLTISCVCYQSLFRFRRHLSADPRNSWTRRSGHHRRSHRSHFPHHHHLMRGVLLLLRQKQRPQPKAIQGAANAQTRILPVARVQLLVLLVVCFDNGRKTAISDALSPGLPAYSKWRLCGGVQPAERKDGVSS